MTKDKRPSRPFSRDRAKPGPRDGHKRRPDPAGGKRDKTPPPARIAPEANAGERVAKVIARAGLCSRRMAESWIIAGRVSVNGTVLKTPAVTVTPADTILVDDAPLPERERTRLWLYHKSRGLVTTNSDPEGRPTVFERLPKDLPRVLTIGRLDINTEGLLLLTNDGGLARVLELPATGWLRRYRVRAYGRITQAQLDTLAEGIAIDGVLYGAIEAQIDKEQGDNVWMTFALREGKNREIKKVLEHLGLSVNRLIRISFGPFQLADLAEGEVREIRGRVLRDQLGSRLADEAGVDFDSPLLTPEADKAPAPAAKRASAPAGGKRTEGRYLSASEGRARVSARDNKADKGRSRGAKRREEAAPAEKPVKISPRSRFRFTDDLKPKPQPARGAQGSGRTRRIWDEEGSLVVDKRQNENTDRDDRKGGGRGDKPAWSPRGDRPDRAPRGDRPERAPRGDRPDRAPRGDRPDRAPRGDRPSGPRGDKPGGGRPGGPARGGPRGGGRPSGGKPGGGRPGGGRPGGGKPGGPARGGKR
ncbi:pseudouridine synthase [Stappia taiwanensis]|uniref:Pseudouridine synthase n=1 Tax=Stappia taiwanensis TaxID=992267 RepID=A0A838XL31_9HYPH|nr:pseudouridine synthase [Stappia taiwanensis]MBA4612029.1 pseudouridine synthase [Stappia taiwanensis]GGE91687.1 hypothetical protein GCM10007285_19090 [Stappia taiwanensis]